MKVVIPSALLSYTGLREVRVDGATLADALADLERQYPGIRFRMIDEQEQPRPHIRFFVNGDAAAGLSQPLRDGDELVIVQALSGG